MNILDPLWITLGTVNELIKTEQELKDDLHELGEQIKLIQLSIRPLIMHHKQSNKKAQLQKFGRNSSGDDMAVKKMKLEQENQNAETAN